MTSEVPSWLTRALSYGSAAPPPSSPPDEAELKVANAPSWLTRAIANAPSAPPTPPGDELRTGPLGAEIAAAGGMPTAALTEEAVYGKPPRSADYDAALLPSQKVPISPQALTALASADKAVAETAPPEVPGPPVPMLGSHAQAEPPPTPMVMHEPTHPTLAHPTPKSFRPKLQEGRWEREPSALYEWEALNQSDLGDTERSFLLGLIFPLGSPAYQAAEQAQIEGRSFEELRSELEALDDTRFLRHSPALIKSASDIASVGEPGDHPGIATDSATNEQMYGEQSDLQRLADAWLSGVAQVRGSAAGLGEAAAEGVSPILGALELLKQGGPAAFSPLTPQSVRDAVTENPPLVEAIRQKRKEYEEIAAGLMPDEASLLERAAASGPNTLAILASAAAGPAGPIVTGGLSAFSPAYTEARDRGVGKGTAALAAGAEGAISGVLERIGVEGMLGQAWRSGKGVLAQTGKQIAEAIASEVPTEAAQELTSSLKEAATGKYDSFDQWWGDTQARMIEAAKVAAVTAGAVGAGVSVGHRAEIAPEVYPYRTKGGLDAVLVDRPPIPVRTDLEKATEPLPLPKLSGGVRAKDVVDAWSSYSMRHPLLASRVAGITSITPSEAAGSVGAYLDTNSVLHIWPKWPLTESILAHEMTHVAQMARFVPGYDIARDEAGATHQQKAYKAKEREEVFRRQDAPLAEDLSLINDEDLARRLLDTERVLSDAPNNGSLERGRLAYMDRRLREELGDRADAGGNFRDIFRRLEGEEEEGNHQQDAEGPVLPDVRQEEGQQEAEGQEGVLATPEPEAEAQVAPEPLREEERFATFLADEEMTEDDYYAAPKIKKVALDVEFSRRDQGPGAGWDEFLAEHGVTHGDLSLEGRRELEETFFQEIAQRKLAEPKVKAEAPPAPIALEAEERPFVPPQVKPGTAQGGFIGTSAAPKAPSPGAFSPAQEAIFQGERKGLHEDWSAKAAKAVAGVKEIGHWMSREHHRLGHGAKFTVARDALRVVGHQPEIAVQETARKMRKILGDLSDQQRELFERRMLLDNSEAVRKILPDAKLPGGLTDAEVAASRPDTDAAVDADPRVKKAVEDTRDLWRSVREPLAAAYREIGMDPDFLYAQGDSYMHRQILDFAKDEVARDGGVSGTLKEPKGRSWQREMKGSERLANLNYYEAQVPVIAQMQVDAEIARQLARVEKEYNIAHELRRMAKTQKAEWQDLIPSDHVIWQPQKGTILYVGERLVDRVAQDVVANGSSLVTPEDLRKSLMVGGPREQWVIPKELAETLDDFGKRIDNKILRGVHAVNGSVQRSWKAWQLLSPRRAAKYMIRNLAGDSQSVLMGNPSSFKRWKEAAGEIGRYMYGDKEPTPQLKGWMARGGLNTTLFQQEFTKADQDRIARMGEKLEMQGFLRQMRSAPTAPFRAYFKTMRRHANFLESILRYATYKDYLSQIEASPDGRPKNFGASRSEEIMALPDKEDRAFWVSNELLGAYDQVSEAGQYLRANVMPFFSFQELNIRKTYRLMRNALRDENHAKKMATRVLGGAAVRAGGYSAIKAGQFLALAYAFEGIMFAANHLFFPDEERDLPQEVQRRAHIVLGRNEDGSVRFFDRLSAFEEARNWFGIDQFGMGVIDFLNGRKSAAEVATDMVKAPLNQAVGSITPLGIKGGLEIATRMSTYPDVTKPRRIQDLPDHLARMFGLENEFRAATDRPNRPGSYARSLRQLVMYESDPGQAAYFDTVQNKERFLRHIGEWSEGVGFSSRTEALRNVKLSLRYGQPEIAAKYLLQYAELGGTAEDVEKSLNRMNPLSSLDEDQEEEFRQWLDADDREKLDAAIHYYESVLESGGEFLDSPEAETALEEGTRRREEKEGVN